MTFRYFYLLGLLTSFAGAAFAGTTTQQITTSFTNASGTFTSGNYGSANSSPTTPLLFNSFSTSTGVLMDATFAVTSSGTPLMQSNAGWSGGTLSGYESISLGGVYYQSSKYVYTAGGGTTATFGTLALNGSSNYVTNYYLSSLTASSSPYGISAYSSVSVFGQDVYSNPGTHSLSYVNNGHSVTAALTYNYLNHANASFSSGSDVNSFSALAGDNFNIWALGSLDTTGLDGSTVTCLSGNCGAFSVNLASFSNLSSGSSVAGTSLINTVVAGNYQASYRLSFADTAQTGVASTRQKNYLTLNLSGNVAAPVPEPETYAMLLAGLGLVGASVKRRKSKRA
jgi:hypothetical protein